MVIALILYHKDDVIQFMKFIHVTISFIHYINLNMIYHLKILYFLMLLQYMVVLYHIN